MDASGTAGLAEGSNDFSELGLKEARDAGSAAFASGDFQRAGKLFVAAAEADLRRSDDQSNDSPDAKTRSPSAAARLYNNGSLAFYLAGDFPSSLEAARRSKDFDPSCAKGHFREGEALMGMKRYDEALSSFEEALRLIDVGEDPESASKVTERLEAAKDAVELVRKVAEAQQELESVNKDEEPKQSVEDLQAARREEDTVPESMQACKRGAQLLSEGRTQEAMAAFREAKASDPFNYQAYLNLGVANLSLGRADAGIRELRSCIKQEPGCVSAYLICAGAHEAIGMLDEAIELYAAILGINQGITQGWAGMARALYKQGKVAEASDIIQAALAIEPDHEKGINVQGDPMMGMLQGFLFAVRGRAAEAASAFMKHLEDAPVFQPYIWGAASATFRWVGEDLASIRRLLVLKTTMNMLPPNLALQASSWVNDNLDSPFWASLCDPKAMKDSLEQMAKEAGTGMPGSVGVPPPSFCLPNERAALLRYCSQEENRNAHWIARGWTLKGFPEFPQGADVGIRAFTVTDAPSQLVTLDKETPLILHRKGPEYGTFLLGSKPLVTVRLYAVVMQAAPMRAYLATEGVCFFMPTQGLQDQDRGPCNLPSGFTELLTFNAAEESCKDDGDAKSWPELWGKLATAADALLRRLATRVGQDIGMFRPAKHDKLRLPKCVAIDFGVDPGSGVPWPQQLQPHPFLSIPEGHAAHSVVRAIMSDAWLLSVELEGGGERSGPANKDRWPVRVGCLQLCSWDEGGEPACKATTIVEP